MAFTAQKTGSPFTTPAGNLTAIAYVNRNSTKRIYYTADGDYTHIFAMGLTGAIDSTLQIDIHDGQSAQQYPARGMCSDGESLFVLLGPLGHQVVHEYRISDKSFQGTTALGYRADNAAHAIEYASYNGQNYFVILKAAQVIGVDGTFQVREGRTFNWGFPTNLHVESGDWDGLCWDPTTSRLLVNGEINNAPVGDVPDKIFGFTPLGTHDDREDFFPGTAAAEMTYNPDDDELYTVHESSAQLYVWGERPRWRIPDDFNHVIMSGTPFEADLSSMVDDAATITARNMYTSATGLQGASLTNKTFRWPNPPEPTGGRATQDITLTFRATLGSHSTDQRITFTLQRSAQAVPVTFRVPSLPRQTVYEPYTPPVGQRSPDLSHGFHVNLSDYVAGGTPPITYTARDQSGNDPGRFQITQRFLNGQRLRDAFVYNAGAVDQSTSSIVAAIGNNPANVPATLTIPVETINLVFPAFKGPTTLTISDTASHSYNILEDFLDAEPQADLSFVGTPPAAINALLHSGSLTLRANRLPSANDATYNFTIEAKNILTQNRTDNTMPAGPTNPIIGVRQTYTVVVQHQSIPDAPPVTQNTNVPIAINSGQTLTIPLDRYIASANPQPTFSLADVSEFTDLGGTAIISGRNLVVTAPPIDVDLDRDVQINAINGVGDGIRFTLTFDVTAVTRPAFGEIPPQTARPGELWTIDLKGYVTGNPTPTIAFSPMPTGDGANATLVNGVVSWQVPDTITEDVVQPFDFSATSAQGTTNTSVGVAVETDQEPAWTTAPIKLRATEGIRTAYDMSQYITAGRPQPSISITTDAIGLPLQITFSRLTMYITPTVNSVNVEKYNLTLILRNGSGSANKPIEVDAYPVFEDNDDIVFSEADYDEIRHLVDTKLDREDLADEIIAADTIVGAAVAWGIDRMPVYPDNPRTLDELTSKRRAILYQAAGLLAASVRISRDPREFEVSDVNEFQLANYLFRKADEEAELAQKRFDRLGLSDGSPDIGIIFEVV